MGNSGSVEGSVLAEDGKTPRLYESASKIRPDQWPIVYSPAYNIGFLGFEKMHPFDSGKWGKVYQFLIGEEKLSYIALALVTHLAPPPPSIVPMAHVVGPAYS